MLGDAALNASINGVTATDPPQVGDLLSGLFGGFGTGLKLLATAHTLLAIVHCAWAVPVRSRVPNTSNSPELLIAKTPHSRSASGAVADRDQLIASTHG